MITVSRKELPAASSTWVRRLTEPPEKRRGWSTVTVRFTPEPLTSAGCQVLPSS
ncbi:hypothetical protein ACQEVV_22710 [Actinacidiphila glaucinigra]